jgi:hypothetical protein
MCGLKLKILVLFYGDNSWTIALGQIKFGTVKDKDIGLPTSFIWINVLFHKAFKCGDGTKFWGYVRTNAEPLYVEFCNFVQCHVLVYYVTY